MFWYVLGAVQSQPLLCLDTVAANHSRAYVVEIERQPLNRCCRLAALFTCVLWHLLCAGSLFVRFRGLQVSTTEVLQT